MQIFYNKSLVGNDSIPNVKVPFLLMGMMTLVFIVGCGDSIPADEITLPAKPKQVEPNSTIEEPRTQSFSPIIREKVHAYLEADEEPHSLDYSPDYRHFAFAVRRGQQSFVMHDGKRGPVFDSIGTNSLSIGNDGRLIYLARKKSQTFFVLHKDGDIQQVEAPDAGTPVLSPVDEQYAYSISKADKRAVIINGQQEKVWASVNNGSIRFSPDGKHVGYTAEVDGHFRIVVDGKLQDIPGNPGEGGPNFSSSGKLAFVVQTSKGWQAVLSGKTSRMYDTIVNRHFPDGLSLEPFQARITVHVNSTPLQGQTSDDFPDIS